MIGKIVNQVDVIPKGYTLLKFPARKFLVVTHEWVSEHDRILGEDGIGQCYRHKNTVQMPDGYERYDGPGSQIVLVEREYFEAPNGWRYEYWVPIKKVEDQKK